MFERVQQMMIKEFIQLLRDPRLRVIVFAVPIIQMLIFCYAVNIDVHDVNLAVYDLDRSTASRRLIDAFVRSGYFVFSATLTDESQVNQQLDLGSAKVVLQINRGFEEKLNSGQQADFLALIDGSDVNTSSVIYSYVARITAQYTKSLALKNVLTPSQRSLGFPILKSRPWFNENLTSRNFYIPGVISILLTLATLTLTSMSIVREKEIGTMEQLIVTPITRMEFIAGKTLPYVCIGLVNVVCILIISTFWFEMPIRGNLLLLFFSVLLYLLTTLGLGLFISTISNTQQEAMLSAFMIYFPLVLLSGFIFPIANMPEVIRWLTFINPLKYFLIAIRGIFLKGIGMTILWPQLLALAAIGSAVFLLAARRFHKTLS